MSRASWLSPRRVRFVALRRPPLTPAVLMALLVLTVGATAFFAGRESANRPAAPALPGTYAAGREAAFTGFDGGWDYGVPYIVTLQRGGSGITYRFARRWPMRAGLEYRICGPDVCRRRSGAAP